jgi:hypothetical protein
LTSPNGFPPEPVIDPAILKKKRPARKSQNLQKSAKGKPAGLPPPSANKKAKVLSAKDKKMLQQVQSVMAFDPETNYFTESTSQVKVEVMFSKPLVPRVVTPEITKRPEEIIKPLLK